MTATTGVIVYAGATLQRAAWQALLDAQPGIQVIGTAARFDEVPMHLTTTAPITLLIDVAAPQPELARQFRALNPLLGILFLVTAYDLDAMLALLQAGATGCLAYDESVGDLGRAVIAVGRGELVLPPTLAVQILARLARGATTHSRSVEALSEREAAVMRLLARGCTNKDIAQTLVLSVRTVETHLRSMYGKIGARSRTEAALWAVQHGYRSEHR